MEQPLSTTENVTRVLFVEDDRDFSLLISRHLAADQSQNWQISSANSMAEAIRLCESECFDVALVDLQLTDSSTAQSLQSIENYFAHRFPVVILSGVEEAPLATQAVRKGVQNYYFKSEVSPRLIGNALLQAIEKFRIQENLKKDSMIDPLTGLYNRRAFNVLGVQQMKQAKSSMTPLSVLIMDLNGFKKINDTFGHSKGDLALKQTAKFLKQQSRGSDIVCRLGGDEFVMMLPQTDREEAVNLLERIQQSLDLHNQQGKSPYQLSLSGGIAVYDFKKIFALDQLLQIADSDLYCQKKVSKSSGRIL